MAEHKGMKVLMIDIETAPNLAYAWGLFKENINIDRLITPGYTLCWAARWQHSPKVHFRSLLEWDMEGMLEGAWELLDEADCVVHYNGKKFDIPTLNREFVKYGFTPPAPYKQVDLYHVVRRQFRFASNKLAFVARELGLTEKVEGPTMEDWKHCMAALESDYITPQQTKSWGYMKKYNENDADMLVPMYEKLLPWIPNPPNAAMYMEPSAKPKCPTCGSENVRKRGIEHTRTMSYQRYHCNDCSSWSRSRLSEKPTRQDVLR